MNKVCKIRRGWDAVFNNSIQWVGYDFENGVAEIRVAYTNGPAIRTVKLSILDWAEIVEGSMHDQAMFLYVTRQEDK